MLAKAFLHQADGCHDGRMLGHLQRQEVGGARRRRRRPLPMPCRRRLSRLGASFSSGVQACGIHARPDCQRRSQRRPLPCRRRRRRRPLQLDKPCARHHVPAAAATAGRKGEYLGTNGAPREGRDPHAMTTTSPRLRRARRRPIDTFGDSGTPDSDQQQWIAASSSADLIAAERAPPGRHATAPPF